MEIKNLSSTPLPLIVQCLIDSFAGYFVKMPSGVDYWERRWKGARADFNYAYGMFDKGKLVGFMIHGVDTVDGLKTAFNTGTGVLPDYRGRRIVKQLYTFAIKELKASGIRRCSLEVIQENERAIKAYQSVGFEITKKLRCYHGKVKPSGCTDFKVGQQALNHLNWTEYPPQNRYAWDYHKNGLLCFSDLWQCYDVFSGQKKIGYFIIYPENGTLAQFDVFEDHPENWSRLFSAVRQISETVKVNNIDNRQSTKIETLEKAGLQNVINQYEMELSISKALE